MVALLIVPLNTRTLQIAKTATLFVFFFETLVTWQGLQSTNWHLFFLKLNSDNNTLLMFVFTSVILFWLRRTFTWLLIFFFIEVLLPNNVCSTYLSLDPTDLNTQLTNGLLLVHPLLLYYFTSMVIVFSLFKFDAEKIVHLYFFKKKKTMRLIQLNVAVALLFSIFLGSWWAQLELSWGGWWGWDFIEIISLNYLILLLLALHTRSFNQDRQFFNLDILIKLIFFMVIVKFNYLESVHNFVSLDFFLQNFYQLLIMYALFIYSLYVTKANTLKVRTGKNTNSQVNYTFIIFLATAMYFYIFVISEFFLIFFQNIALNLFYKNKSIPIVLLCAALMLLNNPKVQILPVAQTAFWEIKYFLLAISWKKEAKTFSFHIVLIGLVYLLFNNTFFYNFLQFSINTPAILVIAVDNCYNDLFHNTQTVSFAKNSSELLYQNTYVIDKCVFKSSTGYNFLEQSKKQQQTILYINLMALVIIFLVKVWLALYNFKLQNYLFKLKWEKLWKKRTPFHLKEERCTDIILRSCVSDR